MNFNNIVIFVTYFFINSLQYWLVVLESLFLSVIFIFI